MAQYLFNSKIDAVIHLQDGRMPCSQISPKVFDTLASECLVIVGRQKDVLSLL